MIQTDTIVDPMSNKEGSLDSTGLLDKSLGHDVH